MSFTPYLKDLESHLHSLHHFARVVIFLQRKLKMKYEIELSKLLRKQDFWSKHEAKFGHFFNKGFRSFEIFTNVHRKELQESGALVKSNFGVFVNDPGMQVEIEKRLKGNR